MHWDDNNGGWLDPEVCAKARREEVEYIPSPQDVHQSVSREVCLPETGRAPIKTGVGTDKGTTREAQHAREVGREEVQDAREAGAARVDVAPGAARVYFHAPARRRVFVELPPEDYHPGDEHVCGLLQYSLYGTRDAAQNWEGELAWTLNDLKLTRESACPCVWQGCIKGEHIVATLLSR